MKFLRGRQLRWVLVASVMLPVALVGLLLLEVTPVAYDPASCAMACHTELDAEAHRAEHKETACDACHRVTAGEMLGLFLAKQVDPASTNAHARVSDADCENCHRKADDWPRVLATEGHSRHLGEAVDLGCLSCHGTTGHAGQGPEQVCSSCHEESHLHAGIVGENVGPQCLSCHNFSAPKPGRKLLTVQRCLSCHGDAHAASARGVGQVAASILGQTDLHGGVDCKLCHEPHEHGSEVAGPKECTGCHRIQSAAGLPAEHTLCEECHEQHAPLSLAVKGCVQCHPQAEIHTARAKPAALEHESCASCHLPHTWVATSNDCVNCHQHEASLVFGAGAVQHQRCVQCHEVHGPAATGQVCEECHKHQSRGVQHAPSTHRDCVSCHRPHQPKPLVPQTCSACHEGPVRQLVSDGPPGHASKGCLSCHSPHADPKASAGDCANCHRSEHTAAVRAEPAEHQNCESCHRPHTFSFAGAQTCEKCHSKLLANAESHQGECLSCHTPHGSPRVAQQRCSECHEDVHLRPPPGNAEHGKCNSCHQPHKAAQVATQACPTCHVNQKHVAQAWPEDSPHHDDCTGCHEPHDVGKTKDCGACHKEQRAQLSSAAHECKNCHAPHQAPPEKSALYFERCENCHQTEARAAKQHTACGDCHKPHAFAVPDCQSCHQNIRQKAGHGFESHAKCTSCHEAHAASLPGREPCLSCHKDKKNHEPAAKACYSCHPFK